jgi:hypothetical protein
MRGPEPIQLNVITSYLKNHTSVDVFNINQVLLAEKNNYLMFPVSVGDLTHHTEIAAYFAYCELMKYIYNYFPNMFPHELNDIEITYDKNEIPHVTLKIEKTYKNYDASLFDNFNLNYNIQAYDIIYENIEHDLPVILLLRDS